MSQPGTLRNMEESQTLRLDADEAGLSRAASLLRDGALVAFPTETVYGLGANARDGRAVARIFEAKGRPRFNPLIVHVPEIAAAREIGVLDGAALDLAEAFWPGALSLVVPVAEGAELSGLVTAGLSTVALRVPEHPLARRLLREAGVPVAAPSANLSGRISPTTADHVIEGLGGRIDAVLDGGACPVGVESTIVGVFDGLPRLLRPGGLPIEPLEACLGLEIADAKPEAEGIRAPGQLASHYAPSVPVRLDASEAAESGVLLGFGPIRGDLSLSEAGDLVEAAANLYAYLRALDARGASSIAVAPVPETGLGRAINDRLRRAAAER